MLANPTCLHIPSLYEDGTAQIVWESADGADGYEIDVHYDEDFEKASTGQKWSDIDMSGRSVAEIDAMGLTWEQFAKLPAQGLSWRNIEFHNPAWSAIDASKLSWSDIQKLPVEFTVYKGGGEKTPGPDQGLNWGNINIAGLNWSEIEKLGWNWEDFMFRPSVGLTWPQLESENLNWAQIEVKNLTWYDFEYQAARGLNWGSLDGRFLNWPEIEAKNLTWKQLENLPPDSKTHIAHNVDIPLYKKKAIFRVRAYKDGEYSGYLTSTLSGITPLFYREDSFEWTAVKDKSYRLEIRGDNMRTFSTVVLNLEYSNAELSLTDFAAQVTDVYTNPGAIPQANLEILSNTNGRVRFRCSRVIQSGEEWSGIVTVLEFKAIKSGNVQIKLY